MNSDHSIQIELKELNSILAGVQKENIYSVPDGYFESTITDIVRSVGLGKIHISANATVPDGYFEGLADEIMGRIKSSSENTAENADLLSQVRHINPYQVPPQYFDRLADHILRRLALPSKVIVMRKRSAFFNYAAAAVITGLLGLSVMSIVDNRQKDEFLLPLTGSVPKTNDFDEALSAISDDTIMQYLRENGEDVNAALVASAAEEQNLPDQIDYLTDEKTLDNLFRNLELDSRHTTN